MAIDTATERAFLLFVDPVPDGTIGTPDRQHILWVYPGVAAQASATIVESIDLNAVFTDNISLTGIYTDDITLTGEV